MNAPYKGSFRVTSPYKPPTRPTHSGMDLVGTSKTIYSTINGKVERAGWENPKNHKQGFGMRIWIKDSEGKKYSYVFAHLSKINVKVGQAVKKGQAIGIEGNTGISTGSHLHYEARISITGSSVNISTLSGIPNKVGTYTSTSSPNPVSFKIITTANLNYRDKPSMSGKILGVIPKGTIKTIIKISGEWYKTADKPKGHWINSKYCKKI